MASRALGEDPYNQKYFHGRITRENAEELLQGQGSSNGLFLLREKLNESGCYALSLCFNHAVYHYNLQKKKNGMIAIEDGKQFHGPVELIRHHQVHLDGLLTKLVRPCNRPPGEAPKMFENLSRDELQESFRQAAKDMGFSDVLPNDQLQSQVIKMIHIQKPWFHGCISRDEAENRINKAGHQDGKFLVRERDAGGSFAIGLSYRNTAYHYKVEKNDRTGKLSIQDGQKFDSLYQMVDHYSKKKDGLLCELTIPLVSDKFRRMSSIPHPKPPTSPTKTRPDSFAAGPGIPNRPPPNVPGQFPRRHHSSESSDGVSGNVKNSMWDDEPDSETPAGLRVRPLPLPPAPKAGAEEEIYGSIGSNAEKIYDSVAKKKKTTTLDFRNLSLQDTLGKGNFGSVVKGIYRTDGQDVPVAVKTLKEEEKIPNKKTEIMKEAELMARLDHPYIVRMIGMCENAVGVMMLVLELANLGPLNKYLKTNQTMRIRNILEILLQVSMGMDYLEGQQFVHRDLAARNVLLVTETYAKISDFGMSKALGLDSQYYVAETAGKWPLKWYAPECIYRFKFSSKGDVWSFGITMWEAMSFGRKPYAKMRGQQILDLLESGKRLDRPEKCPEEVYEVMKICWEFESRSRPHFKEVVTRMKGVLNGVRKGHIRLVQ
ncbi:tyrosine-protein kinase SYK-like [Glandiceps talaboti]